MAKIAQESINPRVNHKAWQHHPGPVLLLAGPGTGKTHQLALRIGDLVKNKGVTPESITVITFTREAAQNLRRRLADITRENIYVPPELRPRRIATMHSMGLEIVRTHAHMLQLPEDFRVLVGHVIRQVLFVDAALLGGHDPGVGRKAMEIRQRGESPETDSPAAEVITQYEQILRANKAIDYDDQIILACQVLQKDEKVRSDYCASATHLLVDEYQDINGKQREMIRILSSRNPVGLFVVGDDDQSIYSFRGGSPQYIRDFGKDFGNEAHIFSLQISRRCPDKIINAGLSVVEEFDTTRVSKPEPTFSEEKITEKGVVFHNVATEHQEATTIGRIAEDALKKQQSVLILIPARTYADPIKRELQRRHIPYDHPINIDDIGLSQLVNVNKWLECEEDNLCLRLCIHLLCESKTLGIPTQKARSPKTREVRVAALQKIADLWKNVLETGNSLWEALREKSEKDKDILSAVHKKLEEIRQAHQRGVDEFLYTVARDVRPWASYDSMMREIESSLDEMRFHSSSSESDVRIKTLQGAKGLEADIVCVVGLTAGVLPRNDSSDEQVAENARLIYVSMSRALEELHLFHARKRDASTTYLSESYGLEPSPFIKAIDQGNLEHQYHQAPSKRRPRKKPGG